MLLRGCGPEDTGSTYSCGSRFASVLLRGCGPEDTDARASQVDLAAAIGSPRCSFAVAARRTQTLELQDLAAARFASVLLRGCGPEGAKACKSLIYNTPLYKRSGSQTVPTHAPSPLPQDKQQEEPAEESTSDSTGSDVTVPDPPLEKSGTLAGDALQPPGSNAAAARDLEQQERRAAALRAQLTEGAKDGEAEPKKLAPAVHGTAKPAEPPLAGRAKCAVCGRCRQTEAQATASHERSVFHLTWQHYSQGMTWRRAQERAKEDSARMWEQWYASRSDAAPSAPVKPRQPAQPAPVKPRQPAPVPPAPVKPRQPKEKAAEAARMASAPSRRRGRGLLLLWIRLSGPRSTGAILPLMGAGEGAARWARF